MIDSIVRKYITKSNNISKGVIFFKFKEVISLKNFDETIGELMEMIQQEHDSYIAIIDKADLLTGLMVKLLLALKNSMPQCFGVLAGSAVRDNLFLKWLKKYIDVEDDIKRLLIKFETKHMGFNRHVRS